MKSGRGAVYERSRGSRWKGPPLSRSSPLGMPSRQLGGTASVRRFSMLPKPCTMNEAGAAIMAILCAEAVCALPR